ncbi:SDR family NAD(P)-dependent oxidoreductase [Citricoccus parietis]|uniref:SDR family NAD(P)-dependent oxidoreductase n=2 Tax=Citricoccus parietis TaxID=592307 RepID=A0ABV5FYX1_9MICC
MTDHLIGRTVVVTGAASGIGTAYARACAGAGAALHLIDRDEAHLVEVAEELRGEGVEVTTHVADIHDADAIDSVFGELDGTVRIDAAFLNAGINAGASLRTADGEIDALDRETWRKVLDINLSGFFFCLQRTAAHMKRNHAGSIIVTGSTAGLRAEPLVSYAYAASKAAVHAVATQAALELAKYGVRINIIAPGPFNTNIGGRVERPAAKTRLWERSIPLGRWGDTRELHGLAVLLASDDSSFMNGSVVRVDGGATVLSQVRADEL